MSPLQAALQKRDANGVIKLFKTMRHKDRVKAVRSLQPQAVHTHAGYMFRALGLSVVTQFSRRHYGICSTLSPLVTMKKLCDTTGTETTRKNAHASECGSLA